MWYKYKKRYYKKKYYNKYNTNKPDITTIIVFLIFGLYFVLESFYTNHPILSNIFTIVIILGIIFAVYLIIKIKRNKDKQYMNIKKIEDMKKLDWREFEKFIEFIFNHNWFKAKVRKWRSDWWIDLDATLNWQKYVIQCKKWNKYKIWVVQLREFYWVVKMDWTNTKWIYITTSSLTKEAYAEYEKIKNDIELWDNINLEQYIAEYKWIGEVTDKPIENNLSEKETETLNENKISDNKNLICDKCWWQMLLRKARRGDHKGEDFYGCSNFPKCRNIIK